jgi:FkbM family methyltransferase
MKYLQKFTTTLYINLRRTLRKFLNNNSLGNSKFINFLVKFDIILRKTGFLNQLKTGSIKFNDNIFHYGDKDSGIPEFIITNNGYEEVTLHKIESILMNDNVFFDLGANIGFYTVLGSKLVGKNGKVISFEPTPDTRKYLIKNILANDLHNVVVEPLAISNKSGKAFFEVTDNSECNSIVLDENVVSEMIEIDTISIDDYCIKNNINSIDLIKMDIEGQEYNALLGMNNINKKSKNLKLIFEFNADNLNKNNQQPFIILETLVEMGFTSFTILLEGEKSFTLNDDFSFLLKIANRHNMNILATK